MFFVLSKILDLFLLPIFWIIISIVILKFVKSEKIRKCIIWGQLFFLLILSNGRFTHWVYNLWEPPYQPFPNQKYSYGVVLTGGIISDLGKNSNLIHFSSHSDRLMQAVILYKRGIIEHILISGGNVSIQGGLIKDNTKETEKSIEFLRLIGIPDSSIIMENQSRNTHENAEFTKRKLTELNAQQEKILLITSAFHMKRSSACFTKAGVAHDVFPAIKAGKDTNAGILNDFIPDEENLYKNSQLIHEIVGYVVYKLMDYC
ncbi:YdcF family protein [Sandaracinomonas limnophila]|uniref:YdcF family protein n=1 Tax=Sandaracinomonas limnophila TaxID=1862386 RepID=A0A437PX35_9BACT|nr:YdcF family protein [Sandaracinomonas limnophila]